MVYKRTQLNSNYSIKMWFKVGVLIVLSFVAVLCYPADSDVGIHNGAPLEEGEAPFLAALYYNVYFICGATIVHKDFVLTHADCVSDYKNNSVQRFEVGQFMWGQLGIYENVDGKVPNEAIIRYNDEFSYTVVFGPSLKTESYHHLSNVTRFGDIALVLLQTSIQFDTNTKSIKMTNENYQPYGIAMYGWGLNEKNYFPSIPQLGFFKELDKDTCEKVFGFYNVKVSPHAVCVRPLSGYGDACYGDFGGPVTSYFSKQALIGVIAPSKSCDILPRQFIKVADYLEDIRDYIRIFDGGFDED